MAQYLNVMRLHENIYYLNAEGRSMIGCERVFKKTLQVEHYLRRNALFIAYNQPSSWRNEMKLEVPGEVSIVADAIFNKDGVMCIVEIDRTQMMTENRDKIKRYKRLLELGVFKQPPAFLWVTETHYRKQQLEKLCDGMQARVFLSKDFII